MDGLFGAVARDGQRIITTPNSHSILDPPLGGDRKVFLRSNLRFGDDDELQWPQPFIVNYGHLACIRKCPTSSSRYQCLSKLWELPSRADFFPDGGILSGIGKLRHAFFGEVKRCAELTLERAALPQFTNIVLVSELVTTLKLLLHHLEFISTTLRTMQIIVRETQRICLELRALLDFEEIFKPRMAQGMSVTCVDPDIIGAFTNDLGVCDALFRAGIPVWLVRPSSTLHSIRVRAQAPLLVANGVIPLDPPPGPPHPLHRTIYVGAGNKLEKYVAIAQYVRQLLQFPDPFGSGRAKPVVAPLAQPSGHGTAPNSRRFTPCNAFSFSFVLLPL
jgi:hypothetical protein